MGPTPPALYPGEMVRLRRTLLLSLLCASGCLRAGQGTDRCDTAADLFYVTVLEEALGFFGSKLIDPSRNHFFETAFYRYHKKSPAVIERGNRSFESDWFIQLTLHRYFCGDYEAACEFALKAEELVSFSAGFVTTPEHNFYYSLTLAALHTTAGRSARAKYRARLDANLERLKIWAEQCPPWTED